MTGLTGREVLQYLLDAGEASQAKVKWDNSGYRHVVIFQGKKCVYKGTGHVHKRLLKSISPLYISMSAKVQNTNIVIGGKNKYVRSLIEEFREIQNGNRKSVKIDLTKVNVKQLIKLIQQNINSNKLAMESNDCNIYMLNDSTMNKLMKGGLIDESTAANDQATGSDEELTTLTSLTKDLTLTLVEGQGDEVPDKRLTKTNKTWWRFLQIP